MDFRRKHRGDGLGSRRARRNCSPRASTLVAQLVDGLLVLREGLGYGSKVVLHILLVKADAAQLLPR